MAANCTNTSETIETVFWFLYGSTSLVILAGNVLTLVVLLRTTRLRESYMDVFLVSLAVTDILMAVSVAPGFAVFCTGCASPMTRHCWLLAAPKDVAFGGTVLNLVAVSYDRFQAVLRPLRYHGEMTKKRVALILIGVWGLSFTLAVLRNAWQHTESEEKVKQIDKIYNAVLVCTFVLPPILVIFLMNVKIIQAIKSQRQRVQHGGPTDTTKIKQTREIQVQPRRERDVTNIIQTQEIRVQRTRAKKGTFACVLVVFVFLVCWFPRGFCNLSRVLGRPYWATDMLVRISWLLIFVQSAANPFIYSFYRNEFRRTAFAFIKCKTGRKILSSCTGSQEPIQKIKQYTTANQ